MACLLKAPDGIRKGVVSFTTQERDYLIRQFPDVSEAIGRLKARYIVGLHHNWHDLRFRHDALFDFNLAGEEDLVTEDGSAVPLLPMDACNFSAPCFAPGGEKLWDVLFVARAVQFKNIPQFFHAIRALYDRGNRLRVLFLCPVPPARGGGEVGLRALYESLFDPSEREYFTFLTMDFDYPFPLDLPTLAHFYRSSRVFVHSAPDERRCRVAAYAWASELPVVGKACVGSLLPRHLRVPPYFFEVDAFEEFPDAIMRAVEAAGGAIDFSPVRSVVASDSARATFEDHLRLLSETYDWHLSDSSISIANLDLRMGRHHGLAYGRNRVGQDIVMFVGALMELGDGEIWKISQQNDPEVVLAKLRPSVPRTAEQKVSARVHLARPFRAVKHFVRSGLRRYNLA